MVDAIDRLMADLDGAAASLRNRGAAMLPPAAMRRVERRAAEVADALLGGEPLPVDGTDELLSVESEVSPPQVEQRPAGQEPGEVDDGDVETLVGASAAAAAAAVGAVVASAAASTGFEDSSTVIMEDDEEDEVDEATVLGVEGDFESEPAAEGPVSWDEAQTFIAEEDSEIPLEFTDPSGAGEEPLYVVEETVPTSDLDEDGTDDPSDAGLVSFNEGDDTPSYITYEEEPAAEPESPTAAPAPVLEADSYVSYDEVPMGQLSDADLALGSEALLDEDEEVTLGSIPRPDPPANLVAEDGSSFSDVGEDALVTIEEGGDDVLGDLDQGEDGVESFDLMPDSSDVEDDEEVTLVSGLDEPEPDLEIDELDELDEIDVDSDEIMVDDSRGAGVHASVGAPRVAAASPRVTAGLYGNPSVPTIREGNDPVPKAAAVQLNAGGGGGRMLGLEEEEEPIELGSVGDYGEDEEEYEGSDGLSIAIQEYEQEEEEEYEEEEELELEPEPAPPPPPRGPSPEEIQAIFDRATAAAHSGALQEAADLFSDVVDADPDHLDAHVGRGRLYLDLGDYSRAMSDFMVAEEIDENSPEPQVAIGDLYFHRKDYRKAIEYFDTALKMSPNHAMAFCRRGISHYYRKNYKEALGDLEKANSIDPDIPNIASFISMAKRKAKSGRR